MVFCSLVEGSFPYPIEYNYAIGAIMVSDNSIINILHTNLQIGTIMVSDIIINLLCTNVQICCITLPFDLMQQATTIHNIHACEVINN